MKRWYKMWYNHEPYYVDTQTQTTTWYPPEPYKQDRESDLPEGWISRNIKGRRYYINTVGLYTTWDHPLVSKLPTNTR